MTAKAANLATPADFTLASGATVDALGVHFPAGGGIRAVGGRHLDWRTARFVLHLPGFSAAAVAQIKIVTYPTDGALFGGSATGFALSTVGGFHLTDQDGNNATGLPTAGGDHFGFRFDVPNGVGIVERSSTGTGGWSQVGSVPINNGWTAAMLADTQITLEEDGYDPTPAFLVGINGSDVPSVSGVSVGPAAAALAVGDTVSLKAKVSGGGVLPAATFTSSAPSRVTVDAATGLAVRVAAGPATITASAGAFSATAAISDVVAGGGGGGGAGSSATLVGECTDRRGVPLPGLELPAHSTNPAICTVDRGVAVVGDDGRFTVQVTRVGPGAAAVEVVCGDVVLSCPVPAS